MMENYDELLTENAPAEQSDYDKASWKNRKKAEREEAFARAADAALQISGSPTLLQNYLNVQAQFDRYSVNNCLLIATSKPEGTAFKDFDGWKKEGVSIAKGETGIVLLIPGKTYIAKDGTEKQSFDTKRVFDISQTTALHKAAPIVQYDPRVLLKALLRQAPCKVEAKDDMNPKINAAYQPNTKSIVVRPGIPRRVQDTIPIKRVWPDGIFLVGNKYSMSFRFTDINYLIASREDKERMFLTYSELLNSLDSGATTKITLNNHRLNRRDFEASILMPMQGDGLDEYRQEYNDMLLEKATGANGVMQEKYITISVAKKDVTEARAYFARVGSELRAHFSDLGAQCEPMTAVERLRILHDFYRPGDETIFSLDLQKKMRLGHDFRDYICPDSMERTSDYIRMGTQYARVLYLKDYTL